MKVSDLTFKAHKAGFGTHARVNFSNGYGASVVTGELFYTDDAHPYEVAVFLGDNMCYDTPITNDVIGHCNAEDVDKILAKIESLPKEDKNES